MTELCVWDDNANLVVVVSWHGVSLLVQLLSGGMGRPPVASSPSDVHDGGYSDEADGRLRHYSHEGLSRQGHGRKRVPVGVKSHGTWASPQPSGATAVALVLSIVLVLVVQLGVWLVVIGPGWRGRDGVGSVVVSLCSWPPPDISSCEFPLFYGGSVTGSIFPPYNAALYDVSHT